MKKKRIKGILAVFLATTVLAGCSKEKTPEQNAGPEVQEEQVTPAEQEQADTSDLQAEQEEKAEGVQLLDIGYVDYSEWVDGDISVNVSYQVPVLSKEEAESFPKLQEAFEAYGESKKEQIQESKDMLVELVTEDSEYRDGEYEYYEPYADKSEMTILRADSNLVSLYCYYYGNSGGAHGYYGYTGHQFDPETGKELALTDIITDVEAFFDRVLEGLQTEYADIYADMWEPESVIEDLKKEPTIDFTVSSEGVTVYFNPYYLTPYAYGTQAITIYFEEAPELFVEKYTESAEEYVLPVVAGETFAIPENGKREEVRIVPIPEGDGAAYSYNYEITVGDRSLYLDEYAYDYRAAIVYADHKYYLYFSMVAEGDAYRNLFIDLQNMTYDLDAAIYGYLEKSDYTYQDTEAGDISITTSYPFIDPSQFYIEQTMDLLGTYQGTKEYHVGENGMPVTEDQVFEAFSGYAPKTKVSLDVDVVDENGETIDKTILPADTYVVVFRTDNRSFVDVQIVEEAEVEAFGEGEYVFYRLKEGVQTASDQKIYRIYIDDVEEWPRTINGVEESDAFAGIMYAG